MISDDRSNQSNDLTNSHFTFRESDVNRQSSIGHQSSLISRARPSSHTATVATPFIKWRWSRRTQHVAPEARRCEPLHSSNRYLHLKSFLSPFFKARSLPPATEKDGALALYWHWTCLHWRSHGVVDGCWISCSRSSERFKNNLHSY